MCSSDLWLTARVLLAHCPCVAGSLPVCCWLTALSVYTGEVRGGTRRGDGGAAGIRARRSRQTDGRRRHLLAVILLLPLCPRRLRRRRVSSSSGKHTHLHKLAPHFTAPAQIATFSNIANQHCISSVYCRREQTCCTFPSTSCWCPPCISSS